MKGCYIFVEEEYCGVSENEYNATTSNDVSVVTWIDTGFESIDP
jgi:hypothetical protein